MTNPETPMTLEQALDAIRENRSFEVDWSYSEENAMGILEDLIAQQVAEATAWRPIAELPEKVEAGLKLVIAQGDEWVTVVNSPRMARLIGLQGFTSFCLIPAPPSEAAEDTRLKALEQLAEFDEEYRDPTEGGA